MGAPFTIEDLLLERRIGSVHAVPGHAVAVFSVTSTDRDADTVTSALWCATLDDGATRLLTAGTAMDEEPQLSPDGRQVAFVSDRDGGTPRVHLIRRDGGEARAIGELPGAAQSVLWSPDGKRLLVIAVVPVDPERRGKRAEADTEPPERGPDAPEIVWRLPYKSDGNGYTLARELHLFVIDVDAGSTTRITDGAFDVRDAGWSPDGTRIAFERTRDGRLAHGSDIWVVHADGNHARRLTHEWPTAALPAWSPDGRWIAFAAAREAGDAVQRLWCVSPDGGDAQRIGEDDVELAAGEKLHWTADAAALLAVLAVRGVHQLERIEVPAGRRHVIAGGERQLHHLARAAGRLVWTAQDATAPVELFDCADDGSDERQLSQLNGWWQERQRLRVERRRFDVPDGDGGRETIDGWLLRADDGDERPRRCLVDVHGGPASYALLDYATHAWWPVLASRGWAILALNPVGSSSYGCTFHDRLRRRWGELDLPQQLAAIDALQRDDIVDERVAIAGKSYGGYLAAWAAGHTDRFRAAVVLAPVANLESHYGTSDSGYYADPYSLHGEPVLDRALWQRLSPFQHFDRARMPTLLLQGKADQRCPLGQAEELFVTLAATTRTPCEMVLYPGASHGFTASAKPSQRVDAARRLVDWVERWVGVAPGEQTDGASSDGGDGGGGRAG